MSSTSLLCQVITQAPKFIHNYVQKLQLHGAWGGEVVIFKYQMECVRLWERKGDQTQLRLRGGDIGCMLGLGNVDRQFWFSLMLSLCTYVQTIHVLQRFSRRLKLNVKLLVEVQSTMTSNYIDAAVYLCYMGSCHG